MQPSVVTHTRVLMLGCCFTGSSQFFIKLLNLIKSMLNYNYKHRKLPKKSVMFIILRR